MWIVADEVYEQIVFDGARHVSIASLDDATASRTITINSLSKTHAMTGWRIGYAAFPGKLAANVTEIQRLSTSAPSAICQRAALAALTGDQSHVARMAAEYDLRRQLVQKRLDAIRDLAYCPPRGSFYVFVNIAALIGRAIRGKPITGSTAFSQILRDEAGVIVNSGAEFGSDRHIRISFAVSTEALDEAFNRIARLLSA